VAQVQYRVDHSNMRKGLGEIAQKVSFRRSYSSAKLDTVEITRRVSRKVLTGRIIAFYARQNARLEAVIAKFVLRLLILFAIAILAAAGAAQSGSWTVRLKPERIVNGAPILFQVKAPARVSSLTGKWLDHDVFFSLDRASKTWYGLAGASLEIKSGSYPLLLEGTTAGGTQSLFRKLIRVSAAKYPSIAVTVSRQFTEPDPEQLKQIAQDKTVKQDMFRTVSAEREWKGRFKPPVEARISDVFGTQRTFNGKVQSFHQGLDYAVPRGTSVAALNSGTVLLARPLYFEGNCVVIDHGQGLLSLYLHLSEFKVHEGEHVQRGQELGLSGSSGRATGPHLHIAVRWQGVYLNPETLLKMNLP